MLIVSIFFWTLPLAGQRSYGKMMQVPGLPDAVPDGVMQVPGWPDAQTSIKHGKREGASPAQLVIFYFSQAHFPYLSHMHF